MWGALYWFCVTFPKLQIVKYVRAIRSGQIKLDDKPKEEPKYYDLWGEASSADRQGLAYIPAPKPKLPGVLAFWILKLYSKLTSLYFYFSMTCHDLKDGFCSSMFSGHEESYNPSLEYIPTQEEINAYQLMFEEDRPKFIPKQ